jgi:hypothetical protein
MKRTVYNYENIVIKHLRSLGEPYPKSRKHELTVKTGWFVDGLCYLYFKYKLQHYGWPLRPRGFNVFIEPEISFISVRTGIAPLGRYPAIDWELVYIRGAHTYTKLMQGLPRSVGFLLSLNIS